MPRVLAAFLAALLFGLGLGISGMTLPSKIIGFLDIAGQWDPSLLFVMVGAIAVHAVSYRLIMRRSGPVLAPKFQVPSRREIDWRLVFGAAIFGAGWGLGGFCPGPALVGLVTLRSEVVVFVASMVGGIFLYKIWNAAVTARTVSSNGSSIQKGRSTAPLH